MLLRTSTDFVRVLLVRDPQENRFRCDGVTLSSHSLRHTRQSRPAPLVLLRYKETRHGASVARPEVFKGEFTSMIPRDCLLLPPRHRFGRATRVVGSAPFRRCGRQHSPHYRGSSYGFLSASTGPRARKSLAPVCQPTHRGVPLTPNIASPAIRLATLLPCLTEVVYRKLAPNCF
jgi:hypothetical protein